MALRHSEHFPQPHLSVLPQQHEAKILPFPEVSRKEVPNAEEAFYGVAFELSSAFKRFFDIAQEFGVESALNQVLPLVEMNMLSYVQEESRQKNMPQFATRVSFSHLKSGRRFPVFQNSQYGDVRRTEAWKIKEKISSDAQKRFLGELGQYYRVWLNLVQQVPAKVDENSLRQAGFTEEKRFPVSTSLKGLAHVQKSHLTAFIGPEKLLYASPSSPFHLDGLSTILRHAQLVYLPELGDFFIVDEGYFSGHTNAEVRQYLQADVEQKPLPNTDSEFMHFQAHLHPDDAKLEPAKLFAKLRKRFRIPLPVALPLGKNVADFTHKRKYKSQLALVRKLFELEFSLCKQNPDRLALIDQLLKAPAGTIQHSLGRAKNFEDIEGVLDGYKQFLGDSKGENVIPDMAMEAFFASVAFVHPDALVQMISWIDCAGTGILGGSQGISDMLFGKAGGKVGVAGGLRSIVKKRSQLEEGCEKYNIDPKLFSANKEGRSCPSCHKVRDFMGPCICPECHFQIAQNGGNSSDTAAEVSASEPVHTEVTQKNVLPAEKTNINSFVSGFLLSAA